MIREKFDPYVDRPESLGEKFLIVVLIEKVKAGAVELSREKRRYLLRHLIRQLGGKNEYSKILGRHNTLRGR
jgi:hypothetical protein